MRKVIYVELIIVNIINGNELNLIFKNFAEIPSWVSNVDNS